MIFFVFTALNESNSRIIAYIKMFEPLGRRVDSVVLLWTAAEATINVQLTVTFVQIVQVTTWDLTELTE